MRSAKAVAIFVRYFAAWKARSFPSLNDGSVMRLACREMVQE
jgi:hypothetical protein